MQQQPPQIQDVIWGLIEPQLDVMVLFSLQFTGLGHCWSVQGLPKFMPLDMAYNASWRSLFFLSFRSALGQIVAICVEALNV